MQSADPSTPPSPKTRSVTHSPKFGSGATTVVSRAVHRHETIDTSHNFSFEWTPDQLNVYASFSWSGAFDTEAERRAKYPMLDELEKLGVNTYPWHRVEHSCAAKPLQCANIFRFLTRGLKTPSPKLPLFLWDISDRSEDSLDGSSKVLWHVCMGMGAVCIILDTKMDERPVNSASGTRQHPSLNYLSGNVLGETLPNGSVTLYVKTLEDAVRVVAAVQSGTFEAPAPRKVPAHECEIEANASDKLCAQATFNWGASPGPLQTSLSEQYDLLRWWEPNSWRGAPHPLQVAWLVRWFSRPDFGAFVSDLTNYKSFETGVPRRDGSGKFQWQLLVGICLVKRAMDPTAALPKIVVLDEEMDTREPCSGTATPIHPALGFMCAHTVNQEIEGITTHYVKTVDEVTDLLSTSE